MAELLTPEQIIGDTLRGKPNYGGDAWHGWARRVIAALNDGGYTIVAREPSHDD